MKEADFQCEAVFEPEDYLHFYADMLTDERTEVEVEFLSTHLDLQGSLRILDLGCGFGRHANMLAQKGHEVVGVDCTPGFLEIARKQAESLGVQVTYTRGDMREISFSGEFDRVIMMFTVFGYFNDEENQKVLSNVMAALRPGGMLCFDTLLRDTLIWDLLLRAGLSLSSIYGDMSGHGSSYDSRRMIVITKKPG